MNELQSFIKTLKPSRHRKTPNANVPVSCWSEKDRMHDEIVDAFVIILRTRGCSWMFHSGCSMCGYFNDSMLNEVTEDQLINQYQQAMTRYQNEPIVKIFTSGSFLDSHEVPKKVQNFILSDLKNKTKKIAIESRPSYANEESLTFIQSVLGNMEFDIGIGLETSQDFIRNTSINKGFDLKDYLKAVSIIHSFNFHVKNYVLVKPPFLTEPDAIKDVKNTIDTVLLHAKDLDIISFNPTSVQKNTLVEYLWRRNQYRPPWLWSIIEILQYASDQTDSIRLQCDITGGGKKRGAHNCFTCDQIVLSTIQSFSLHQDKQILESVHCKCKDIWNDQLILEPLTFGSIPDVMNI